MTTAERILTRCEQAFCLLIVFFWLLERWAHAWWPVAILICLPHVPAGLPLPVLTYVRLRVGWRRSRWLLAAWMLWLAGSGFCLLIHGPQWLAAHAPELRRHVSQALADRRSQIARLLPLLQGPCPVAGDFNSQPRDNCLRELEGRLVDSFRDGGLGWGFSFESTLPLIRIDYIWHSPELECLNFQVIPSLHSDHMPLVADFRDL